MRNPTFLGTEGQRTGAFLSEYERICWTMADRQKAITLLGAPLAKTFLGSEPEVWIWKC